ncbi:PP2C family protein-serine/threonine phosphatase [Halioxenophilus aromaticivorans]|uniref:Protein phosphatase 2C domain-containing protein n=1 Tax=Halioxenophilus aromaticivorans TaxID=1306992 RepID=A0AAV3U301_9ALTE
MAIVTGNIETSSFTHTGCVRKRNEDALLALPKSGIWAVADGMGGHDAGDYASHCVISHIYQLAKKVKGADLVRQFPDALKAANQEILAESLKGGVDRIIGTTLVALILEADRYHCFWSGDSRCYLYRDEKLTLITRDHTRAQAMIDEGSFSEYQILNDPAGQALTHAIGIEDQLLYDGISGYIYEGDRFLLCSDGLTKVFDHRALSQRVAVANIDQINIDFLSGALDAGAPDNLSSILVNL